MARQVIPSHTPFAPAVPHLMLPWSSSWEAACTCPALVGCWGSLKVRNYKGNWGWCWCSWQVSAWPVHTTRVQLVMGGGLSCIIHEERRAAILMCLHSNVPVITGCIYTHYSSVQREMNPFTFRAAVLPTTARILSIVRAQTTSTLLGGKSKQSSFKQEARLKMMFGYHEGSRQAYEGIQEPYK